MKAAGLDDIERGERGSTAKSLTVSELKVEQEKKKLAVLETKVDKRKDTLASLNQEIKVTAKITKTYAEIDGMEKKNLRGKMEVEPSELVELKSLAKVELSAPAQISDLNEKLRKQKNDTRIWRERYEKLLEQVRPYLGAVKRAPERVKEFLADIIHREKEPTQAYRPHKEREQER